MDISRVAVVFLAAVLAAAGAALALSGDEPERLRTDARPAAGDQDRVVQDGMRVTATGSVVSVPGRPVRFCAPASREDIGYLPGHEPAPEHCASGVDVEGVDLAALADRREKDGAVEGRVTLTGRYRAGVLVVEEQVPPAPYVRPPDEADPPCDPPEGGWPRDPGLLIGPGGEPEGDVNMQAEQPALDRYRAEHPGDVVTLALVRPFPDSVLMGVTVRDEAAAARAERALRPAYDVRLCVVVSRHSRLSCCFRGRDHAT